MVSFSACVSAAWQGSSEAVLGNRMHTTLSEVEVYQIEAQRARDLAACAQDAKTLRFLIRIAEAYEELAKRLTGSPDLCW